MTKKRRRSPQARSRVRCPFCGEEEEVYVDPGGGQRQTYVEDCPVCCRPRVVHVEPGEGADGPSVWLERGD
jgi:hypothetical protein